ncbi:integrase [Betaproteobacteria bacterium PRO7]|jgi:integrase|nr:integrase [Betaproteobacteria bacterium PRO7]
MKTFLRTPRLTSVERAEAEKVLAATTDLTLGAGLVLRPSRRAKDDVERPAYLIFRFTAPDGRRREMGLGAIQRTNPQEIAQRLSQARVEVAGYREQLRQGIDPLEHKNAERERARAALQVKKAEQRTEHATLARVAREYHERVIEPNRTTKHAMQWIASLERHVPPAIWHKPIARIEPPELLAFLEKLQAEIPETAMRIRQRLEAVFDDAMFRKLCRSNAAEPVRRKLREAMKGKKRERGKFAMLPYAKAPDFARDLRSREGIAARALEFGMLTAARTSEIIGATWGEFDLDAGVWTIPAARMKAGEKHVVYLPPRAVEIVRSMQELQQPFVFPSPALDGKPLSNMGMLTLLRRMDADGETTVHGLCRATFSTWAYETSAARPEVIEACLAHREANLVKAAYNRAQFAKERRALLQAWAEYLDGKAPASNVIEFPQPRAVGA